jgi:hypothetical protein
LAKPRAQRLKVFQAHLGFFDVVVAAPSQAAALAAWGVHQNLFASGEARPADDEKAVAAAMAAPGVVLRRAVGSHDPFVREGARLPQLPPAAKPRAAGKAGRPPAPKPKRPKPDRAALEAAEAALAKLEAQRKNEEAELAREAAALEARRGDARIAYAEAREAARKAVAAARQAYRKAGGRG